MQNQKLLIKKKQLHRIFSLTEMMLRGLRAVPGFQGLMFVPQQTAVIAPACPQARGERQLPALLLRARGFARASGLLG